MAVSVSDIQAACEEIFVRPVCAARSCMFGMLKRRRRGLFNILILCAQSAQMGVIMFLIPSSPQDDSQWYLMPQDKEDPDKQHNFSVIHDGVTDYLRSLNVPFCINIIAGGRYSTEQIISLTSLSEKEHYRVRKSSPLKEDKCAERIEMHQHDYFEMMYVMNGMVEQHIEKGVYLYDKGTACLLNRNTRHFEVLGDNYFLVFLCLSREFIKDSIAGHSLSNARQTAVSRFFNSNLEGQAQYQKDYLEFIPVTDGDGPSQIDNLLEDLSRELFSKQPGHSHMVIGLISRILAFLQDESIYKCSHVKLDSSTEAYIFSKVTQYMENTDGKISRTALAKHLNYSSDYINRAVKKHSGMSISEYNQVVCLRKAERMLTESNDSISHIIAGLGFQNKTHFYKLFERKHGITPMEYRHLHTERV